MEKQFRFGWWTQKEMDICEVEDDGYLLTDIIDKYFPEYAKITISSGIDKDVMKYMCKIKGYTVAECNGNIIYLKRTW